LFKPTKRVEAFDSKLKKFAEEMRKSLLFNDGLGLAAPQVNKNVAFCVVRMGKEAEYFCNPEIIKSSPEQEKMEEGCLSFPNVFLEVPRAKEIEIRYQDIAGNPKNLKASGILARTLQHEIDHLNGISFVERA